MTYAAVFFIYAFVGWFIEVGFYLYKHRRFVNRGFLNGPLIPIYGFSAVLLHVFAGTLLEQTYSMVGVFDVLIVFVSIIAVTTLLELLGGALLLHFFRARWWDYSSEKYNYRGFVCLKYALIWGVFGTALYLAVHIPFVVPFVESTNPSALRLAVQILSVYALFDATVTLIMLFNFKKWMTTFKSRLEILLMKLDEAPGNGDAPRLKGLKETVANVLATIRSNAPMNEVKSDLDKVETELSSVENHGTKKELSILQRLMKRITKSHLYKGFPNLKINLRNKTKDAPEDDSDEGNKSDG